MPRLFVALELPPPVLDGILGDTDHAGNVMPGVMGGVEGARWQRADQLHLTLAFMGMVEGPRADDLASELDRIQMTPFRLGLRGVNKFGKEDRVKTLWAGVDDPQPVVHLHEKVMRAIGRLNVPLDERRFVPHVTLARFHRRADPPVQGWLNANENFATESGVVTHFTLFSSHQTDEGSYYRAEARFGPGAAYADDSHDDGHDGLHDDHDHWEGEQL